MVCALRHDVNETIVLLDHVSPSSSDVSHRADLIRQTTVSSMLVLASKNLSSTSRDSLV